MAVDKLKAQLAEVRALRADPTSDATVAALRKALGDRSPHLVAAAAKHAGEHLLRPLGADLAQAYDRLSAGDAKADPGCAAKAALIEALSALDYPDAAPFLHGVDLVQLEKGFGPPVDVAIHVRGHALMALVGLGAPGTPEKIAERLADPEARVRAAAVRCAVSWGDPALARALIVLRLATKENDPDVLTECFEALIRLNATGRVEAFLEAHDVRAESAALALGAARVAVPALIDWWSRARDRTTRKVGLVAIGLSRTPEGLAFLLERLANDAERQAGDALEALAVYLPEPSARVRIVEAARAAGLADRIPRED